MPTIQELRAAKNKTTYLLEQEIDSGFYSELSNSLDKSERIKLAKEIVRHRDSSFPTLITKLSEACFKDKGPEFIRKGASDFLANILIELVKEAELKKDERQQFVKLFTQNKEASYPENYQFPPEVAYIFSTIHKVATSFDKKHGKERLVSSSDLGEVSEDKTDKEDAYSAKLASNLANKVFNVMVLDATPKEDLPIISLKLQSAVANEEKLSTYFSKHLPEISPSFADGYYLQRKLNYDTAIDQIEEKIANSEWKLGGFDFGFGFFQGGVKLDGVQNRVPHRVAKMYQLISEFRDKKGRYSEQDTYQLYVDIQKCAQEALENPRRGQKQSTKEFYNDVLNDVYLGTGEFEVEDDERARLVH
ncbi:hypothetical protein A8135_11430 [Legionella jamestowniensis]|uniref:Substrate of the Dot/Icm secretion system n=1 Tax=Legionella jamestowniensis TaxID=455 RepID=A0ABX2XU69_9GAMM|nr:hypothetical protein [Legionella jamestowniensis]OCH98175.1 hypothetical protein A8135_11430 [Legionella jamestowniensis]